MLHAIYIEIVRGINGMLLGQPTKLLKIGHQKVMNYYNFITISVKHFFYYWASYRLLGKS